MDQYGEAVPGTAVNFCTDLACTMVIADENGTVTFNGEPADYHVQVLKVPEGYSYDPEFEMQTGNEFGEWFVTVKRN